MNGRVYDYNLGRFMSVEPLIQSPTNSQSLNPYSYLMNNPLSGTDPTGYAACQATRMGDGAGDCLGTTGGFADGANKPKLRNQKTIVVNISMVLNHNNKQRLMLFKYAMYDLTDADLEPMGGGIKSVNYIDHGIPTTHYFANDEKQQKRNLAYTFDDQQLPVVSTNLDSSKKIVLVLNSDNPGKYYLFDNKANKAQYIKEKSPHLEPYKLAKSTTLTVKVENNVNVEAMLTKPASEGNGVLLVYPHGDPIGRDYATYDPKIQYLTSRGYSVLTVNFRGSVGFDKEFLERGKAQFGQLIEQDISTLWRIKQSLMPTLNRNWS